MSDRGETHTVGLRNGRLVVTNEAIRTETGFLPMFRQMWRDSKLEFTLLLLIEVGYLGVLLGLIPSGLPLWAELTIPVVVVALWIVPGRLLLRRRGYRFPGRIDRAALEQVQTTSADLLLERPKLVLIYRDEAGELRGWPLTFARRIWGPQRAQYDRAVELFERMDIEHGVVPIDAPLTEDSETETDRADTDQSDT